jgi:3-hydroxyisobutyrate dehydrogenase-like beta-hydroxyacid dehydrogenase
VRESGEREKEAVMKVGFVGLGQMGRPMAERLAGAGHELRVYNRTRAAAEPLGRAGAKVVDDPQGLLDAEAVVSMLSDDAAVSAVWLDSGLTRKMPRGCVHLNMSTISMGLASRLAAEHAKGGSQYVAGPVFGRPAVAAQGQLDVIAGGAAAAVERCQPLLKAMAKQVFAVGEDPAKANAVKIARNFLLATVIEGLGEAFALARKSGVAAGDFLNILTSTSLNAPAYKNFGKMIVEQAWAPGFALPLGLKDVELALATAKECGMTLPSGELVRANMRKAIAAGRAKQDWVALAGHLADEAGLKA